MSREEKLHFLGHRQRLRQRFLNAGADALADYELLEMILFAARPRGDVKPLAKSLLSKFGSLAKVVTAEKQALLEVQDMGEAAVAAVKAIEVASQRILKEEVKDKPVIQSWTALLDYCQLSMAHKKVEEFRVLFLNHKNALIADEVMQTGTVNHTPVYPREVVKRALELSASAMILLHNHPSGDSTPSKADIEMTKQIIEAAKAVEVKVHDHLIIAEKGHYSFKSHGIF
jgi:DNA repair protein RadC